MIYAYNEVTKNNNFYENTTPVELIKQFGSPLYVYNENILRARCKELTGFLTYPHFSVNYSVKANSNLHLLKIVHDQGLNADAMSPGEIFVELEAGFKPDQILYISNNVSADEMLFAVEKDIVVSVDSVSQLRKFGQIAPGGRVCIRFNSGVGAGHHEHVVTGGKKTKFGVDPTFIHKIKEIIKEFNLKLVGINQHIGSLFMESDKYIEGVVSVLALAELFPNLEFVDFGGGFGIPYEKQAGESRLNFKELGEKLDKVLYDWTAKYGKQIMFKCEPGRYIAAECCTLLGSVNSIKTNYNMKYVGTDLGFNVLARPIMYGSHHDVEIYRQVGNPSTKNEVVNIVGNICESGDIIAKSRELPEIFEDDIIGVLDAGAYGFCMSSNYNNRLKPAEVLICENGDIKLIRRRDTLEDLLSNF